ncbi:MAG TPA: BTAD domain-containing putative transcriptional regulator [Gemmatimonadales bacterium]|nr:BTAD domain-containing putative transcriptional regulator [Gemmatimonadales bacterium]
MMRLLVLGRFELTDAGSPGRRVVTAQPKRLALLAYLALAAPAGHHRRDALLGLFWPELDEADARRALRQSVHHLRRVLGADAISSRADDQIGLAPGALGSDLEEFDRAIREGREADALALYQGDFFDGVFVPAAAQGFDDWVERVRAGARGRAAAAAWRLAEAHDAAGCDRDAAAAALRAHELAPDDECALRRLLMLLERQRDRLGALRVYDAFARRLARDYGVAPAAETEALAARIRADSMALERRAPDSGTPPRPSMREPDPFVTSGWALVDAGSLRLPLAAPNGGAPDVARKHVIGRAHWLVATAVVLLAAGYAMSRGPGPPIPPPSVTESGLGFDPHHSVVVGPIENRTPYPRLAQAIGDAFERELAGPHPLSAVVTGSVSAAGGSYVVAAELVGARGGNVIAVEGDTAADSTDLIPAVSRLSARLRQRLLEYSEPRTRSAPVARGP